MKWSLPILLLATWGCSSDLRVLAPRTQRHDAAVHDASSSDAGRSDAGSNDAGTPSFALGSAFDHTCAVRDGQAYCWGRNDAGQLGLGDMSARLAPARLALDAPVLDLCAGDSHSCALAADGRLHCWGKNLHGELGLGDFEPRLLPSEVPGVRFVRIACGAYNTCGIRSDGALSCWGDNFEGKLGQGDPFTSEDSAVPRRVAPGTEFYDVSVGQGHVCAVSREGGLFCWGRNSDGQLGLASDEQQRRVPTRVGTVDDYRAVAAGQRHTCALRAGGELSCWGTDNEGSLGLGVAPETLVAMPRATLGEQGYRAVSVGWFHSCALRRDGSLHCWGRNTEGQLGLGDLNSRPAPAQIGSATNWLEVSVGHFHTCARSPAGIYCWGENDARGQLGLGEPGRRNEPAAVTFP